MTEKLYHATHQQICDQALAHYLQMVAKLGRYDTIIPKAIAYYRNKEDGKETRQ